MKHAQICATRLAFDQGQVGAGRRATHARRGLSLRVWFDQGVGLGEASPYPGLNPETIEDIEVLLGELRLSACMPDRDRPFAEQIQAWLGDHDALLARSPALRFALETAAADMLSQLRGTDMAAVVSDGLANRELEVATLLPTGDQPTLLAAALTAKRQGFGTMKLKCQASIASDLPMLRETLGSDVRIRCDFNGSLSMEGFLSLVDVLREGLVELVEDPVAASEMCGLSAPVLVFWDEQLDVDALLRHPMLKGAVLKPTVIGGFVRCLAIAERLQRAKKGLFVTHSFEGSCGLQATRALAFAMPACDLAHGVDTHSLLSDVPHLATGPVLRRGHI